MCLREAFLQITLLFETFQAKQQQPSCAIAAEEDQAEEVLYGQEK